MIRRLSVVRHSSFSIRPTGGRSSVVARLLSLVAHPLAIIFLLALAVRLVNLTYHSLWFDEVMSTFWAAKPAAEIWRVGLTLAQDKHPPLYYWLLHLWMAVFGGGDAAVRSLGALIGALAVLPTYGIGARLGGRRAGLLAALLLAVNPYLVWYSQEARMFAPATTFGLVGLWGILAAAGRDVPPGRLYWPFAVCGLAAALYTYLFSAFLLPVAGAWVFLIWWRDRQTRGAGRRAGLGAAALAAVGLLFLPLARAAWSVSGAESLPGRAFEGMAPALWRLLKVYAVGWPGWPAQAMNWVAVCAGALALLAALSGTKDEGPTTKDPQRLSSVVRRPSSFVLRRQRTSRYPISGPGSPGVFLAAWVLLPLCAGGLLLARDRTVFAETRYFIFLVPALCLAWGWALDWLWVRWRAVGMASLALMLGVTLAALPGLWSPQNRREAWREAAAFVEAHAGPNDAILIQVDYVHVAFDRYFRGPQAVFYPFTDRIADPAKVDAPLEGLAGYDAVWLVQSHHTDLDPGNLVAGWFGARYPLITEAYPAGIAIHGFSQHYRTPALPAGTTPLPLDLAAPTEGPRPAACVYYPATLAPRDDLYHPPSAWIHATVYWMGGPSGGSTPTVRLTDAVGQVWGLSLDRSNDAFHIWPPARWQPGELVRVDYDVNLNPVTPPGAYRLVIEAPEWLPQPVVCGDVRITGSPGSR